MLNQAIEQRCHWATHHPLEQAYHDAEWGIPHYDDQYLFELLVLESAQAGLSWLTVLKKREGYRQAFAGFDYQQIAQFGAQETAALLDNAAIIRNRAKIAATINNAQQFLALQAEYGRFADYLWQWVDGKPVVNHWQDWREVPANTPLSDAIAKDLKKRGFKFFGTTTCYAFLQATGVVNDHTVDCFRYAELLQS